MEENKDLVVDENQDLNSPSEKEGEENLSNPKNENGKQPKQKIKKEPKMPKISKDPEAKAKTRKTLIRVLPVVVSLLVIILVATLVSVLTRPPRLPYVKNAKETFYQNDIFKMTNGEIYQTYKDKFGLTIIINEVDEMILKQNKNKANVSFFDAVTSEELEKELKKRIFGDKEPEKEEDKVKKETEFYDRMFQSGIKTKEEVKKYIQIELARKAFVQEKIDKEYLDATEKAKGLDKDKADDKKKLDELKPLLISDEDIEKKFKEKYNPDLNLLFVSFPTQSLLEKTLRKYDVAFQGYLKKWVSVTNLRELNLEEITRVFIALHNEFVQKNIEGFPNADLNKNLYLRENTHYSLQDGKIKFTNEGLEALKISHETLEKHAKGLYAIAKAKKPYNKAENFEKPEQFYTVKGESKGNRVWLLFLADVGKEEKLEDHKDEIIKSILESRNTSEKLGKVMNEERKELKIIDFNLARQFKDSYYKDYKVKKQNGTNVVAIYKDHKFITDDLFKKLLETSGLSATITHLQRNFVLKSEKNKIYDLKTKKVLDKGEWDDIVLREKNIKEAFSQGQFAPYGFPASYGWSNFVRTYFQVNNLKDLNLAILANLVEEKYAKDKHEVTEAVYNEQFKEKVLKEAEDYFDVSGSHVLIFVKDLDGKNLKPEQWTEAQRAAAKKLYDYIITELKNRPEDDQVKFMEKFASSTSEQGNFISSLRFKPQFSFDDTLNQKLTFPKGEIKIGDSTVKTIAVDENDYKFSEYITLGLEVKFETLANAKRGKMVKPFEEALIKVWKYFIEQDKPNQEYGVIYDHSFEPDYLETEFGYHVYRANRIDIKSYEHKNGKLVIKPVPEFSKIKTYLKDKSDKSLTYDDKKLIEAFFNPVHTEFISSEMDRIKLLSDFKTFLGTEKLPSIVIKDTLLKLLDLQIKQYNEKLKYFKK